MKSLARSIEEKYPHYGSASQLSSNPVSFKSFAIPIQECFPVARYICRATSAPTFLSDLRLDHLKARSFRCRLMGRTLSFMKYRVNRWLRACARMIRLLESQRFLFPFSVRNFGSSDHPKPIPPRIIGSLKCYRRLELSLYS